MPTVSYAQRFEDLHLLRCFGERSEGFYIDIGAGHPVHDNVSFAFYLKGWRGITVEPNLALAELSRAVRPRDHSHQVLVGAAPGEATFHLVQDFHGFSTVIESHARSAASEFGKPSQALTLPMVTLAQLCAQHAPAAIDFLKVDVEGYEHEVLRGADWQRFRPKIVLVEALAPYTLAPAWDAWEPLLVRHGYRHVFSDSLNRYYLAPEAGGLARHFEAAVDPPDDAVLFRDFPPALEDEGHRDHSLARLLARAALTRVPLIDRGLLVDLVTAGLSPAELDRPATAADLDACWKRLFGDAPMPAGRATQGATVRDLYAQLVDDDVFRTACGRISAGYAW